MALTARICLFALCLVPVVAATASAQPRQAPEGGPPVLPALPNPARLLVSVPLTPLPAVTRKQPPLGERAVRIAARELGTPYRYGGNAPGGFDCSGLTSYVYGRLGIELPHNAAAQYSHGRPVDRDELLPGDLVFFHGLGHVGLYIGRGRMIHAPQSGERVEIQSLASRRGSVRGARRIVS